MQSVLALILALSTFNLAFSKDQEAFDSCDDIIESVTADNSPSKKHFEDLLQEGTSAPIKKFLKLWYPENESENFDNTYFFKCQPWPWGAIGGHDHLTPECKPDTLYSWGPSVKLQEIAKTLPTGGKWTGAPNPTKPNIYTALTPVSTYAYGLIQIRFKIKPGLQFDLDWFTANTIRLRSATFQEFIIHDAATIESWSYGTPEQYDEIVKDILRIISEKRAQGYYLDEPEGKGFDRLYGTLADGTDPSEEVLKKNLLEMIRMILKGEGRIHYSKGTCRNRAKFFSTDRPTYFNPN